VVCNRNGKSTALSRKWQAQADNTLSSAGPLAPLCLGRRPTAAATDQQSLIEKPLKKTPGSLKSESEEKKEQVVETTCGSHEKTSKDNFYKIRGSHPLD
jgi:hypothetical protein